MPTIRNVHVEILHMNLASVRTYGLHIWIANGSSFRAPVTPTPARTPGRGPEQEIGGHAVRGARDSGEQWWPLVIVVAILCIGGGGFEARGEV